MLVGAIVGVGSANLFVSFDGKLQATYDHDVGDGSHPVRVHLLRHMVLREDERLNREQPGLIDHQERLIVVPDELARLDGLLKVKESVADTGKVGVPEQVVHFVSVKRAANYVASV